METCVICNKKYKRITSSHLKTHGITNSEYKKKNNQFNHDKRCSYKNSFHGWQCPNKALSENEFCILHLESYEKDKSEFLSELEKLISIQANDSSSNIIYLEGIHFPIEIVFKKKTFNKRISFSKSVFYEQLLLQGVTFEKKVNFKYCNFKKNVKLKIVTFSNFAEFGNCIFKDTTIFEKIYFNGVTFHNAIFENKVEFNHCDYNENASFRNIKTPKEHSFMSFYFCRFPDNRKTWFEYNDMSKISLLRCDLRFVKFDKVKWYIPKWPATKRNSLINEFVNYTRDKSWEENLYLVKEEYQLLKLNYEENRNFAAAGDFHYGEMECQRKSQRFFQFLPTLTTIYWVCSGYGERIKRAVLTLCILLVLWCFYHMFSGLNPNITINEYNSIDYELKIDTKEFNNFAKDFTKTFIYILEILTREEKTNRIFLPSIHDNAWINGDLINNIGFIFVYLQVLLLVLAVRRKFHR